MSTKRTPKLGPVLDKFQMCAGASYAKHCKDPVAAAESDLLGRLIALTREGFGAEEGRDFAEWEVDIRALLAETKGGP